MKFFFGESRPCITSLTQRPSDLQCLIAMYTENRPNRREQKLEFCVFTIGSEHWTSFVLLQLWARIKSEAKDDKRKNKIQSCAAHTILKLIWCLYDVWEIFWCHSFSFGDNFTIKCQWEKPWNLMKLNKFSERASEGGRVREKSYLEET